MSGESPFDAFDRARAQSDALDEVDADYVYNAYDVTRRGWPRFETGCAGTVVAYEQQGLRAGALQGHQLELAKRAPKLINIDYAMREGMGATATLDQSEDLDDEVRRSSAILFAVVETVADAFWRCTRPTSRLTGDG